MTFGKIKKLILSVVFAGVVALSAAVSACTLETAHPRARITFEFNSETYVVDYTLYRNMYPQTVRHFIELADSGFYDDMVVHDYSSNDWLTGAYGYDAEDYGAKIDAEAAGDYFELHSKDAEYISLFDAGKLTASVYGNIDFKLDKNGNVVFDKTGNPVRVINKDYALPVVMGEFYNNINQEIKNGALTATYGVLKMIYNTDTAENITKDKIYVTPTSDQIIMADYKNNCATSVFSVQVGESSSYGATNYCVFAAVRKTEALEELTDAVSDYYSNLSENTVSGVASVNLRKKAETGYADYYIDATYKLPKAAIVIKSVKITKY